MCDVECVMSSVDVEGFHASSEQNLRSDKENNLQQKQVMKSSDAIDSKTIFQMT